MKKSNIVSNYIKYLLLFLSLIIGLLIFTRSCIVNLYDSCVVDHDTIEAIMLEKKEIVDLDCRLFFSGEELAHDTKRNYYLYSMKYGAVLGINYNPTVIILTEYSDMKIVFDKKIQDVGIENNDGINMIVYNNDYYYVSEIKCTTLPVISINTEVEIPDDASISEKMYFSIYDNRRGVSRRFVTSDGMIHVRGASTLANPKKSFRISLTNGGTKNKISLLGMRKDDDWILDAISADPEKVRNVFNSNLWMNSVANSNSCGLKLGVEYRYVELFLNNEYHGLYALGYPIQDGELGLEKNDSEGVLYRCNEKLISENNDVLLYGGGEVAGYKIESKHDSEFYDYLVRYLVELSGATDNPYEIMKLIDVNNAIDFYLYTLMIQGWDNIYKNHDILIKKNEDSFKMLYIPWDMDLTWGLDCDGCIYKEQPEDYYQYDYGPLYMMLQSDPLNTGNMIRNRYELLRKNAWSNEVFVSMIDSYENQIFRSGAYCREVDRWPENSYIDSSRGLSEFREYVLQRVKAMDEYVDSLPYGEYGKPCKFLFQYSEIYSSVSELLSDESDITILEIMNKDLLTDEMYYQSLGEFGIPRDYVDIKNTLKNQLLDQIGDTSYIIDETKVDFVVCYDKKSLYFGKMFLEGKDTIDTEKGVFNYYIADDGGCGLYLDGNEIYTSVTNENIDCGMRIIHIDSENNSIISTNEYFEEE